MPLDEFKELMKKQQYIELFEYIEPNYIEEDIEEKQIVFFNLNNNSVINSHFSNNKIGDCELHVPINGGVETNRILFNYPCISSHSWNEANFNLYFNKRNDVGPLKSILDLLSDYKSLWRDNSTPNLWCYSDTVDPINENYDLFNNFPGFSLLSVKRAYQSPKFKYYEKMYSKDNIRWNEELKFVKEHFNEIKPTAKEI